ncbi:hypothetical protein HK097_010574 [Rhizophlyctis rosea]|uniref:Uncharacterized protein n=1 Tax=Rhizophlyctis rosea TaxID=64517 RepID=A0AAD5SLX8_9FUNG|nr:hypothetical protein HK097_010574 [Rhizophlyctis rosea]
MSSAVNSTRSLTLLTINDDILLSILECAELQSMHSLERTYIRLHSFLRNSRTILALLRSESHPNPLLTLMRFPALAVYNSGVILDVLLTGPKPPLFHVEMLLWVLAYRWKFGAAATKVQSKAAEWYGADIVGKIKGSVDLASARLEPLAEPRPIEKSIIRGFFTLKAFEDLFTSRQMDRYERWAHLTRMLEGEGFPLVVYFQCRERVNPHVERAILYDTRIGQSLRLSDIFSRLPLYSCKPDLKRVLFFLYKAATTSEKEEFRNIIRTKVETGDFRAFDYIRQNYWNIYKTAAHTPTFKNNLLRYLIRHSKSLPQMSTLILDPDITISLPELHNDIIILMREDKPLIGWLTFTRLFRLHHRAIRVIEPAGNAVETLMLQTINVAEWMSPGSGELPGLVNPPTTDYFSVLEGWIKDGTSDWRPSVAACEIMKMRGECRRRVRTLGLLEWLQNERGRMDERARNALQPLRG